MRKRLVSAALPVLTLLSAFVLVLMACTIMPSTPPIVGKWRHGLPETRPSNMDARMYEELKKMPEQKTYHLEFFKDGQLIYTDGQDIITGRYRLIGDEYVEIKREDVTGAFIITLMGAAKVQISGDTMTLELRGQKFILKRVR